MPSKSKKSDPKPSVPSDPPPPAAAASVSAAPVPAPNPNPKPMKPLKIPSSPTPSPHKLPKSSTMPPAAVAAAAIPSSPRKSVRRRKIREFPDDDPSSLITSTAHGSQRFWSEADADNLMKSLLQFRLDTGATPTHTTLTAFYDSVKPTVPANITQEQLYNKIRSLRHKYNQATTAGHTDTPFYKIASEVWPVDPVKTANAAVKVEVGSDDESGSEDAGSCLLFKRYMGEYFKKNGLPVEMLEEGLKLADPAKVRALEMRWRKKHDADLKNLAKWCDLQKEIYLTLRGLRGRVAVEKVALGVAGLGNI